jgi:4-amino-4-deoxy-L-arabinose transferase-like glycosyltransferase
MRPSPESTPLPENNSPAQVRRQRGLLLILIVAAAAALRLTGFDLMEFKHDEVEVIRLTRYWLQNGIPQYGIMSGVGVRNPPGFLFLLLPLVATTGNPLWIGFWITLANIALPLILYCAGRTLGRKRAGLWAGALSAVHPWLILYARKIWAQSLLPPLVTLLLLVLVCCIRRSRSRAVFWLAPLVVLIPMTHLSGFCIVPVALAWTCIQAVRRRLHVRMAILGIVPALFLLAPYATYLAASRFADVRIAAAVGHDAIVSVADTVKTWLLTGFAGGLSYPFTGTAARLTHAMPGPYGLTVELAARIATATVWLAAAAALLQRGNRPASAAPWWLACMVMLPPALYALRGVPSPPHYFIVGLPPLLLLAGLGLDLLADDWQATRLAGATVIVTGVVVWLALFSSIARNGGSAGDYGTAFRHQAAVARFLSEHGVTPHRLDATLTRDQGIGILYLMSDMQKHSPLSKGQHAVVVNPSLARGRTATWDPMRYPVWTTGPLVVTLVPPKESHP